MGIIEVKRPDPTDPKLLEHCGMAVLISPRVAITCAHVVNAAIPRMLEAEDSPPSDTRLTLVFPMVAGGERRSCCVTKWRKMGSNPLDDIAVLELEQPAPTKAGTGVLTVISSERDQGDTLSLFGVRADRAFGEHVSARFLGEASPAWRQIVVGQGGVEPGFSGAGVWDENHQATVGIAVRRHDSEVGFFLPAEDLIEFAGDIPCEKRDLSPTFARFFTLFGAMFFLALLFHLLADRMREFPRYLSLGLGNEMVAAFWGLHLTVLLMPLLLCMFLLFAKAYREHPWWMRVPQFGFMGTPARPASSKVAAVATLVLLVAGPLYLNGHFMRRLHSRAEMKVYIDAEAFGYDPKTLVASGQSCGPGRSAGYCTHPDAGLYSIVPPGAPGKGGYVNNYYQIGGLDRQIPESVTFYPIAQPTMLWLLTALCFFLSAFLVRLLAKPARRLIDAPAPSDYLQ